MRKGPHHRRRRSRLRRRLRCRSRRRSRGRGRRRLRRRSRSRRRSLLQNRIIKFAINGLLVSMQFFGAFDRQRNGTAKTKCAL